MGTETGWYVRGAMHPAFAAPAARDAAVQLLALAYRPDLAAALLRGWVEHRFPAPRQSPFSFCSNVTPSMCTRLSVTGAWASRRRWRRPRRAIHGVRAMTAPTRKYPKRSGFCTPSLQAAPGYNPHERCKLEGCECACHAGPTVAAVDQAVRAFPTATGVRETVRRDAARLKVTLRCLQGNHRTCEGHQAGAVTCGCPVHAAPDGLEPAGELPTILEALAEQPEPLDQVGATWPPAPYTGQLTDEDRRALTRAFTAHDVASLYATVEGIVRDKLEVTTR